MLSASLRNTFSIFRLLIFIIISSTAYGQQPLLGQAQAISLRKTLEAQHYQPRPCDDALSGQILFQLIEELDPNRVYFLMADWNELSVYRTRIDDELNGGSWQFLPLVTSLYKQRLQQADKLIGDITRTPFTFSTTESISLSEASRDSLRFAATETEYRQRWIKWLKYQTLDQMVNNTEEILSGDLGKINAREPAARQKIQTIEKRKIRRILEYPAGFDNYVAALFLNTVAECFDLHSNYFSPVTQKNFETALSKEGLSFGMDLEENEQGDVTIARLVPGGPAWKSNELHKGDVLLAFRWAGKNVVDLTGADAYEAESLLNASTSNKLELTVRKSNGVEKKVMLIREKIREDENIVKSYILKGDKKVGYISLPGFYTETEDATALGCANDIAKEIIKLREAKVEGLILDIRYNGGGSLQEGLNLAGIFIDEGPLGMIQGSDHKPLIMKDMNRGTIYDGPLVVMVNGQSASASELLAATLQDYNRALIVGSPTFGKATGQIVLPLSAHTNPMTTRDARPTWGFAKVTVKKLYRITGKSAQLTGVKPHVYQPDIFETVAYRENAKPFALTADSVSRKVYYNPLTPLPVNEISQKSAARMATHPAFRAIEKLNELQRSRGQKNTRTIPLHPAAFRNSVLETYQRWQTFQKAIESTTTLFTVENTGYDKELMRMDTYSKEINDVLTRNIKQDIYIEEAYQIMKDFIYLTTRK